MEAEVPRARESLWNLQLAAARGKRKINLSLPSQVNQFLLAEGFPFVSGIGIPGHLRAQG